jgi:hypothetical protein
MNDRGRSYEEGCHDLICKSYSVEINKCVQIVDFETIGEGGHLRNWDRVRSVILKWILNNVRGYEMDWICSGLVPWWHLCTFGFRNYRTVDNISDVRRIFCTRVGRTASRRRARRVPIDLAVIPSEPLHGTMCTLFQESNCPWLWGTCYVYICSRCWYFAGFL